MCCMHHTAYHIAVSYADSNGGPGIAQAHTSTLPEPGWPGIQLQLLCPE